METISVLTNRQTLTFALHGTWDADKNRYVGVAKKFTLYPKMGIQEVPAWVTGSSTWPAAVKAGQVVQVNRVPQPGEAPIAGQPMPDGYELAAADTVKSDDAASAGSDDAATAAGARRSKKKSDQADKE